MRNMTNTNKIVISVLTALLMALVGVLLSGGLHNDTKAAAVTVSTKRSVDLTGTYHQTKNGLKGAVMTAVITNDKIEISLKLDSGEEGDSSAEGDYWVGSFNATNMPDSFIITSDANTKQLNTSILGSQDNTKTFTYEHGDLSFPFSMMGIHTTVHLSK